MKCKTVYLIVDPRLGKNVQKLTDMLALFAAARWKTEIAIKQYGGHTLALATKAALRRCARASSAPITASRRRPAS